jgi:hypothetical protein
VRILDPIWAVAFALAAAVTHRLSPLLAAIEARRRMRTSSRSFPPSSCSRRTPTLSHHRHPSPEEPPCRREPQPSSTILFATLGDHPHDPLSILPFSPSHLVHWSALGAVLRWAARSAMASPGFHRPFVDRRLRLEPEDTPSHFKSWPKIWEPTAMDPVYGPWTYSTDFSIENNSLILNIRRPW